MQRFQSSKLPEIQEVTTTPKQTITGMAAQCPSMCLSYYPSSSATLDPHNMHVCSWLRCHPHWLTHAPWLKARAVLSSSRKRELSSHSRPRQATCLAMCMAGAHTHWVNTSPSGGGKRASAFSRESGGPVPRLLYWPV